MDLSTAKSTSAGSPFNAMMAAARFCSDSAGQVMPMRHARTASLSTFAARDSETSWIAAQSSSVR
eukprot:1540062-Pyramimonas_sp.AAC.1